MLRSLNETRKNKSLCEVRFLDGNSAIGYVTRIDEETFDIFELEPILTEDNHEFGLMGEIVLKCKPEELDFVPVKQTYMCGMIHSIAHNAGHKVRPNVMKSLEFMRDNFVYPVKVEKPIKKARRSKQSVTKNSEKEVDKN